ncbi:MAG: ABC transporter substrate-binding protein [Pseudomonadota bacterium]
MAESERKWEETMATIKREALSRRGMLKLGAATGAAAAAGLYAPAVHAQSRTITIGYVSPQSGPLAAFAEVDDFIINGFLEAVSGGVQAGGRSLSFEVAVKDSQSNPNRAAEVAKELIVDDEIDLMVVAHTPETTNPVSTICEIEEIPCISTLAPWQPWFVGRQGNPGDPASWSTFDYTYHFLWGLEDLIAVFTNMWNQLETNKSVGGLFPNDADGNAWGDPNLGMPPALDEMGFRLTDPGRYQNLTDDFSAQINAFKDGECEIVTGVVLPPDFATFWNQARQQGYAPKAASIGKAILFPSAVNAIGDSAQNLSSEVWWSNVHPFRSSLTGASAAEVCDAYEATAGRQWTQPLGFVHALLEVAVDVVKRVESVRDPDEVSAAIAATELETIVGRIAWDGAGLPPPAQKNVAKTPLVGGQWRKSDDGLFRLVIVDNQTFPDIPLGGEMEAIA